MNTKQRIEKLVCQIEACICKYKLNPSSSYLYDFERYKVMGETIIEKHSHPQLENFTEIELPRLIREARQL
jgi:hypothetical protein